MNNKLNYLNIFIILLLVGSVIAAGSSTGANSDTDTTSNSITDTNTDTTTDDTDTTTENANKNEKRKTKKERLKNARAKAARMTNEQKSDVRQKCEASNIRKDRIKCRLEYIRDHKEEFDSSRYEIPEACRDLRNQRDKNRCETFYKKSQTCYEKKGIPKNKCFKRLSNFGRAKLKDQKEGRNEKARDYIVLLLYDIQEKLEDAIENDRIDSEKGTDAVDKIVEIKEAILSGKTKSEVRPLFQELKGILRDIKSKIDEDGDENEPSE